MSAKPNSSEACNVIKNWFKLYLHCLNF